MGYNNYGYGAMRHCSIKNGQIIVRHSLTNQVITTDTTIPFDVPEQCNDFVSPHILIYLEHDGKTIVCRDDGTVGIFEGDVLVGLRTWNTFNEPIMNPCGYINTGSGVVKVYLDLHNPEYICTKYGDEGLIPKTTSTNYLYATSQACLLNSKELNVPYIVDEKGEFVNAVCWILSDKERLRNSREFF